MKTSTGYITARRIVIGAAALKPQRTLTLAIRKRLRRKNGVAPRSVKSVMSTPNTMSSTTEYGPTLRPRTISLRTSRKSARLTATYDPTNG